jgi:YD repeat-containing protein
VVDGNGIQSGYKRESVIGAVTELDRDTRMLAHYTYSSTQFPYYVQTYTDANGNVTRYDRDGNNRVKKITYPDQSFESFTYNSYGEVTSHTLTNGGVWQYNPDPTTGMCSPPRTPLGTPGHTPTTAGTASLL